MTSSQKKFKEQKKKRGWDDSETWDLSYSIAKLAYPRLKRFKKINVCYPIYMTKEKWDKKLDHMIYAMKICQRDDVLFKDNIDWDRVNKGLKLFGKHFRDLWW